MRDYKVGDHILVKLSGGRIVQATIKAILETTEGVRLQVSFGNETALIYPWQIVIEPSILADGPYLPTAFERL
jgi:hypothetical protein